MNPPSFRKTLSEAATLAQQDFGEAQLCLLQLIRDLGVLLELTPEDAPECAELKSLHNHAMQKLGGLFRECA